MKGHIVFTRDGTPVCQAPERLGDEFVMMGDVSDDTKPCRRCDAVLIEYNERFDE